MRYILIVAAVTLLAGCGANPRPVATPASPVMADRSERGDLIGLDAATLIGRFGRPQLEVHEGDGTKLQFAAGTCVLDAYLYPPTNGGAPHVAHVDSRNRDGHGIAQAECISMIEAR